ncbi:hypothetical protein PYW08_000355 [Mythimna loreyi]|uniref:Uncharacterized protein n=1 Tax=Mythimna loreyi TaxID=667449 RepID=A0ACC2RC80_9NEOP|nr:hypothetical protein PYW08_000355 [Mythimna loreyi]
MAPKKEKKDDVEWKMSIIEAPLEDENFKVKVIFIETAGGEQERMYLSRFEIFATEEKRFVIKNICKTETFFMINHFGGEKKVKDPNLRAFEECQTYLADKKDIPPDLLALVIKQLMLKMKDEYLVFIQEQLDASQGSQKSSPQKIDKAGSTGQAKTTGGNARKESHSLSSVKSKGKGLSEQDQCEDRVYGEDWPTDGPNLYVAITGFIEPYLPGNLVLSGIPLAAIVQIRIDPPQTKVPSAILKTTKKGQSAIEGLAEKYTKFWDDLQLVRTQDNSNLNNTAFVVFSPPALDSDDLFKSSDIIYDELCFLMYDIQDLSRQHLHYKENMNFIDVPEYVSNQYFNTLYEQYFDDLPLECVNIYAVLDSILQTSCITSLDESETIGTSLSSAMTFVTEPKNKIEEKKEDTLENIHLKKEDKLENVNLEKEDKSESVHLINTLCNTDADENKRLKDGQEYDDIKEPVVLHHDNEGIAREEWRSHLPTPLSLQDFFDYIVDEHYEWIQNEERIHDENLLMEAQPTSKDVIHTHVVKSCIEKTDVEMDLIMEDSLTYYEEFSLVEEAATETTEFTESLTTKLPLSVDTDSKEIDKKPRKSKSRAASKVSEPVEEIIDLPPLEYELVINEFEIIQPNGYRKKYVDDVPLVLEKLLIKTATDYYQGEVFSRRMDGTNILMNKDGLHCVTFPDKTKIITSYVVDDIEVYPEWTDEELEYLQAFEPETIEVPKSNVSLSQHTNISSRTSVSKKMEEEEVKEEKRTDGYVFIHILYSIEHPNFSTISINNINGTISVESPNETVVTVDKNNNYEINLDSETSATFDGENLFISYEACSECRAFTNCNITIMNNEESSLNNTNVDQMWLKMTDSFNTQVVVSEEGAISLSDEPSASGTGQRDSRNTIEYSNKSVSDVEEKDPDAKSESSLVSHGKCREMYLAKNMRFFILRRDFTCAELLHRVLVEEYKRACRWQPWCSINEYDSFGDHRNLISILTPVHLTESEKWLMASKQASKPKFMTYKNLKEDPGEGFYRWMRAHEQIIPQPLKPDNMLPERLPRAYILRTLEQQWNEEKRKDLKGARELTEAVLRYRCVMAADCQTLLNNPIIDMRTEEERHADETIQALAHKIYEDLKAREGAEMKSRAKASTTTKTSVNAEGEMYVEGEYIAEEVDQARCLEEERERLLKEAEAAEEINPALKRYWHHRDLEQKQELLYSYLQREGSVPAYFCNALDGAVWWDEKNGTAEAIAVAERRKMTCVCADNEATVFTESTTK